MSDGEGDLSPGQDSASVAGLASVASVDIMTPVLVRSSSKKVLRERLCLHMAGVSWSMLDSKVMKLAPHCPDTLSLHEHSSEGST